MLQTKINFELKIYTLKNIKFWLLGTFCYSIQILGFFSIKKESHLPTGFQNYRNMKNLEEVSILPTCISKKKKKGQNQSVIRKQYPSNLLATLLTHSYLCGYFKSIRFFMLDNSEPHFITT